MLARVRDGDCDVAVGSRFVSGEGYEPYRYLPSPARRFGTALLRRAMGLVLRRPFADATSGLYAVNAKALPLLAEPFKTEAPEVEALLRLSDAGLRVDEVPVRMERAGKRRLEASRPEGPESDRHGDRHTRRSPVPPRATIEITHCSFTEPVQNLTRVG